MSSNLIDNFSYKGKKPLDERKLFATIAEMKAYPENQLPKLFDAFCEEDGKKYVFNKDNTIDETTGKWREFQGASGTGADGKSAYEIAVDNGYEGTEAEWLESLKGADGINGTDGVTPTLTIGNVSTLEPGTDATASITGDGSDYSINLGIPKGADGEGASVDLTPYQQKTDNSLNTTAKTVVGAINEVMLGLDAKADLSDVTNPFNFKGSVVFESLPSSDNTVNDTYYVTDKGCNYTWNGTAWAESGSVKDISDKSINANEKIVNYTITEDLLSKSLFSESSFLKVTNSKNYAGVRLYIDLYGIPTAEEYTLKVKIKLFSRINMSGLMLVLGENSTTKQELEKNIVVNKDEETTLEKTFTINSIYSSDQIFIIRNYAVNEGIDMDILDVEISINDYPIKIFRYTDMDKNIMDKTYVAPCLLKGDSLKETPSSFYKDLANENYDNCMKITYDFSTETSTIYKRVVFDLGETVEGCNVDLEFMLAQTENMISTHSLEINKNLKTTAETSGGSINIYSKGSPELNTCDTAYEYRNISLTGTGRYFVIRILATVPSEPGVYNLVFKYLKFKRKDTNTYAKVVLIADDIEFFKFNESKELDYGGYLKLKEKDNKYVGKILIGFGDSLTFGENGASAGKGIMYHIGKHFPHSIVLNKGNNGARSESLFTRVSEIEDYRSLIAALICYGMNDGSASGSIESSIPSLICKNLETVITDGITVNEILIDTEDKYWALFTDDWYGNMGKGIEYINFYNPMAQIYLHSPHSSDEWQNHQALTSAIADAMKSLAEYYSIPYIDTHGELGINNKNSHIYRLDWAHLGDMGNEIKGNFLANQIKEKLLVYPYDDETEYSITGLTMNRTTESVAVGSSIYLYVKVAPYNANNKNIIWSADNENVTIEKKVIGLEWQKVKVTGVTAGESVITATSEDGEKTATCTVTVTE